MIEQRRRWQIEMLFSIALFLSQLSFFAQKVTFLKDITDYIEYFSLVIYLLVIILGSFYKNNKASKLIYLIVLFIIGAIVCYVAKASAVIYVPVIIMSVHALSAKKMIKTDLFVKIAMLIIICMSSVLGLTSDRLMFRDGVARPSFGFAHPNHLGYILAMIYADYVLVRKSSVKKTVLSVAIGASMIGMCLVAGSRTPLYIFAILIPIDIFRNRSIMLFKIIARYPIQFMPVVFLVVSVIVTLAYDAHIPFAEELNEMTSDRLSLQNYYFKERSLGLFGEKVTKWLDNGYLRIFYNYGILAGCAMLALTIKAIRVSKTNNPMIAMVFISLLIYALSEHHPFMYNTTPLWAIIGIGEKGNEASVVKNESNEVNL